MWINDIGKRKLMAVNSSSRHLVSSLLKEERTGLCDRCLKKREKRGKSHRFELVYSKFQCVGCLLREHKHRVLKELAKEREVSGTYIKPSKDADFKKCCQKCRNHQKLVKEKGHKKADCVRSRAHDTLPCLMCQLVEELQVNTRLFMKHISRYNRGTYEDVAARLTIRAQFWRPSIASPPPKQSVRTSVIRNRFPCNSPPQSAFLLSGMSVKEENASPCSSNSEPSASSSGVSGAIPTLDSLSPFAPPLISPPADLNCFRCPTDARMFCPYRLQSWLFIEQLRREMLLQSLCQNLDRAALQPNTFPGWAVPSGPLLLPISTSQSPGQQIVHNPSP